MDEFNEKEKEILERYITNINSNVFALKNLPEVVKGALFSRYSRSSKSLKRLLLDEFLVEEGESIINEVDVKKAEEFYDRVLIGFGDDSVAELAFAHIALEDISMIASKAVEDSRIGLSPLEKSTRYVYFDKKRDGKYLYYEEPAIMHSRFEQKYTELMNFLFDSYGEMIKELTPIVEEKFPRKEGISERAYRATIRAKVCDLSRGLLPASTLTNVGLAGNGRSFEYLIIKLSSSPLKELNILGEKMHSELRKIIPSFVKRSFSKHGEMWRDYFIKSRERINSIKIEGEDGFGEYVKLIDYDEGEDVVIAALLYEYSKLNFENLVDYVKKMKREEKEGLVKDLFSLRENRRHKPGRAFEMLYITFELETNFGAYRDLQRHRILTQMRQLLTTKLGYDMPKEVEEYGLSDIYKEAMKRADELYREMEKDMREEAQYVVPLAYRVRYLFKMNLREAFHLCELRSSPQGHPDYRRAAIEMGNYIKKIYPIVGSMKYLNEEDVYWNRLDAEKRLDKKIEEIKRKYGG